MTGIVVDTSALLAVILGEPERDRIVEVTSGKTLFAPEAMPWEIGNAFSAMLKRGRISLDEALKGLNIFQDIPFHFVKVDIAGALALAHQTGMYAYDGYFLECAARQASPLLTLDHGLKRAAKRIRLKLLEV